VPEAARAIQGSPLEGRGALQRCPTGMCLATAIVNRGSAVAMAAG